MNGKDCGGAGEDQGDDERIAADGAGIVDFVYHEKAYKEDLPHPQLEGVCQGAGRSWKPHDLVHRGCV